MKTSYVFLAPGFEEIEALATVDIMRRAGMPVVTVAVGDSVVVAGAHGVAVNADCHISELAENPDAEWLVAPGGMPGASNLSADAALCAMFKVQDELGGNIAAICAAPAVVLAPLGVLDGRRATCYPGFEGQCAGAEMTGERVVVDGHVITANGPSSAVAFALAIVTKSMGQEVADGVAGGMLCSAN